jgi:hypothetical protein
LQVPGPQVALVTPANGATVVSSPELGLAATFGWRIGWQDAPASGTVLVVLRTGTDPDLTQNVVENTFACPVRSATCRTSFKTNRVYGGRYYWRVSLSGAARATSETWSFLGVARGGTAGRDRTKPRVRALSGLAQRGQTAFFAARAGDDRGIVRLRAVLMRRGRELARATAAFRSATWARRQTLYSSRPLSRGLAAGRYQLCVTAWDRAGNAARSCAPYRVR